MRIDGVAVIVAVILVDRHDALRGDDHLGLGARGLDQPVDPALEAEAVDDDEARRRHRLGVGRGRHEAVRVAVRPDQGGDGDPLAADLPHEVAEDREGRHDPHRLLPDGRLRPRRRGPCQAQRHQQHPDPQPAHRWNSSLDDAPHLGRHERDCNIVTFLAGRDSAAELTWVEDRPLGRVQGRGRHAVLAAPRWDGVTGGSDHPVRAGCPGPPPMSLPLTHRCRARVRRGFSLSPLPAGGKTRASSFPA